MDFAAVLSSCPSVSHPVVSRFGAALSPQEKRQVGRVQDAEQIHQIRPEIPVCLLHADQDRQQTPQGV